jgi:8-oxo-dGTP diphosphatase
MVLPHYASSGKRQGKGVKPLSTDSILYFSLGLNVVLILSVVYLVTFLATTMTEYGPTKGNDIVWHGGHPSDAHPGSCWCGAADKYCMCTPNIAVDVVIASGENKEYLWLVRRKDTNQLATMGGFVEIDETVEHAVKRELKEEMGMDLKDPPILFGMYSDPRRDNRRRTASAVYIIHLDSDEVPHAGDDAKDVQKILMDDIEKHEYFADHRTILLDYRSFARGQRVEPSTEGDFAPDILRATCTQITNEIARV